MQQSPREDVAGPVKHVLLAEFDIDQGATLSLQYPSPTGADEHILAELMLPDGAHLRSEDWTVFYLNRRLHKAGGHADNITDPAHVGFRMAKRSQGDEFDKMSYVLNCVKMKEDKTVRRGAMIKALAVCTTEPYIQIYKPVLSLALDDYYSTSSSNVLERLFVSLNSISRAGCPRLSRAERIILRYSDRKDLFQEKFPQEQIAVQGAYLKSSLSSGKGNDVEQRLLVNTRSPADQTPLGAKRSLKGTLDRFSSAGVRRMRRSSRGSLKDMLDSSSSRGSAVGPLPDHLMSEGRRSEWSQAPTDNFDGMTGLSSDTHFFETTAIYGDISIPIKVPVDTLSEEVGDYSLIALVKKFSPPVLTPFPPPFHPQLHTNDASTHPIILLINALLTEKRILFLGHGQSASNVVGFVLALCSLTGHVLRGFTERAFPYSNLAGLDTLEATPGYIAGVINPRFEDLPSTWDILCDTETGRITVSKYLVIGHNDPQRTGGVSLSTELDGTRNESLNAASLLMGAESLSIQDNIGKSESSDNVFIEEILEAIASHSSEAAIRARFSEYVHRFIRLASRYEEEKFGQTNIGLPSKMAKGQELGSGYTFASNGGKKNELSLNSARIEGWRQSRSYEYWEDDFKRFGQTLRLRDMDVSYQIARLRYARSMSDEEVILLFERLANKIQTEEQVVEFLSHLAPFPEGLASVSLGLFHPNPIARQSSTQLLETLLRFSVSQKIMRNLSAFQHAAYLEARTEGN